MTEAEILSDIVAPGRRDFTPEAARSILNLQFSRSATQRIKTLLRANQKGNLSEKERGELDKYLRVGQLVDLLQAKARLTLRSKAA